MSCKRCNSQRVARISSKSSDCNYVSLRDSETDGYVPRDMGIGGGDYVEFCWCLDCGQIQGKFPLEETALEATLSEDSNESLDIVTKW